MPTLVFSPDEADGNWFQLTLAEAIAKPDEPTRFDERELGPIQDVVAELEAALEPEEDSAPPEPAENPMRHVGRNDSLPLRVGQEVQEMLPRQRFRAVARGN
jgi:hypothetical protein